jgi:putative ABC transport system substrate-binding protein
METDVCALDNTDAKPSQLLEKANREQGGLVFSLGSTATRMAVKEIRSIPIVAGLVLNDDDIKGSPNATGVVLDFPLEVQFQWIRRILPECRNIGVLYNPARNLEKIQSADKLASSMGLTLHAQAIQTGRIPRFLQVVIRAR